jgi:hypothetical protein
MNDTDQYHDERECEDCPDRNCSCRECYKRNY